MSLSSSSVGFLDHLDFYSLFLDISLFIYLFIYCDDFSCCRAQALGTQISVVVAHGLQQLWLVASGAQTQ